MITSLLVLFFSLVGVSSAGSQTSPIPISQMTPADRRAAEEVIHAPTLSRRTGAVKFLSKKEVYEYLLDHPDAAATAARALKAGKYQMKKAEGGSYWATDGNGVTGHFRVIYRSGNERIFFLDGAYHPGWLPSVPAKAIVALGFEHKTYETEGFAENHVEATLKIDNSLVAFLAKLLRGLMGDLMEKRMNQVLALAAKVSEKAYQDPDGFLKELEAAAEFPPQVLNELREKLYPR